eukprot:15454737-Alexandrium_andersonii.AAC.1
MSDCYPTRARCIWIHASTSRVDISRELLALADQPSEATWAKQACCCCCGATCPCCSRTHPSTRA